MRAEVIVQAQEAPVQRLQCFLSAASWDAEAVNDRRLAVLMTEPAIAPHAGGVLVIDETGDRKDGTKTAHVAHQYLGSIEKIANGIVSVTRLWADEAAHSPLDVVPYESAARLPRGGLPGGGGGQPVRGEPDLRARPGRTRRRRAGAPRTGGRRTWCWPATGRAATSGWWPRPPTRGRCPQRAAGS
jgi:hypothetical protein